MANEWLTPAEAGAIAGVGPDRMAQLARQGAFRFMRTPGGQLRLWRADVEARANPASEPPADGASLTGIEESAPTPMPERPQPSKPKWEDLPPWKQRVREAEAEVEVLKFDDQRDQLLGARAERQAAVNRAAAEQAARAAEAERLRHLKSFALSSLPYGVPAEVRAEVARQLECGVTSQRYPAGLAREHAEALLRAEVERYLQPWRAREARRERVRQETRTRNSIIDAAEFHVSLRTPRDWDSDTRDGFKCEVRRVLEDEYQPDMDQTEANEIARGVLDDWLQEEEEDA